MIVISRVASGFTANELPIEMWRKHGIVTLPSCPRYVANPGHLEPIFSNFSLRPEKEDTQRASREVIGMYPVFTTTNISE